MLGQPYRAFAEEWREREKDREQQRDRERGNFWTGTRGSLNGSVLSWRSVAISCTGQGIGSYILCGEKRPARGSSGT